MSMMTFILYSAILQPEKKKTRLRKQNQMHISLIAISFIKSFFQIQIYEKLTTKLTTEGFNFEQIYMQKKAYQHLSGYWASRITVSKFIN